MENRDIKMEKFKVTVEEMQKLVEFERDSDGDLFVKNVNADVTGNINGDVYKNIRGDVYGNIRGNVFGLIRGKIFGIIRGRV